LTLVDHIGWFFVPSLEPCTLGLLSLVDYLGHDGRDGPRLVVLWNNAVEVSGGYFLNLDRYAKGIPCRFTPVPLGEVGPTILSPHEEEVMFPLLQLGLPLDGKHKIFSIIETIPSSVSHSAPFA